MILVPIGCALLGFICGLIFYIYIKLIRPQKQSYDTFRAQGIPCEPFIPIFGQVFDLIRANNENKSVEYFFDLSKKYNYCCVIGMGPYIRLVLAEPELIADVLGRSKGDYYDKAPDLLKIVRPLIGAHNLLVSEDEEHNRARKMLNPAFHYVNLQSMVSIMSSETSKILRSVLSSRSSTNQQIRIDDVMNELTLSIIASSAFGQSFDNIPGAKENISTVFNGVKEVIQFRTLRFINQIEFLDRLPFWGRDVIEKGSKLVNEFIDQAIADRRNGVSMSLCSGKDILDLLLSAIDDNGQAFSDQQIKDEALTFVLAGHETTGNLMTWIIYMLATHKDVLEACREEVDRVLPNDTIPTYEHTSDLQIIEAVIYETLRLYPPAPFVIRRCIKGDTIGGNNGKRQIYIPPNAEVFVSIYSLHRREDYWSRPLEFDYKRWIRDPISGLKPKLSHPFAYLPFAAGSRNCIGQNFAILEAKIILAMFVQQCDFELVPGQMLIPDMKGVTMRPKHGMFITLKKRH